ncbi:MAG TPA: type II toxin-antitoxin system VapC family toxin [Sphingopyxis sp.]|nr:type II toxin-antitoxin system VapC family toxin [Sphingopyxis sp.]HMP46073.1 type II toxin-antitoxin system VapC family toxin [Sphingopyxis sp.]HMQ17846.1 type II toxin-antitoxin system VapC family toxin [Sphingopyxis sp.]
MSDGYLLDTHALLWVIYTPERLREEVRAAIGDSDTIVYASAISAYEIALKHGSGRLGFAEPLARDFLKEIAVPGFLPLPLTAEHARLAGALQIPHRDPFDRMLIAQAQIEQLVLVSNETLFDRFGVIRFW